MKLDTNKRKKFRVSNKAKKVAKFGRFRLSISRSAKNISAQIIDDTSGNTMVSCSSVEIKKFGKNNIESSKEVGVKLAAKAKKKGIKEVLFDRGGYLYHGKIKSFAEGAREGGLIF